MATAISVFGGMDESRKDTIERLGRMVTTLELIEEENIEMAKSRSR